MKLYYSPGACSLAPHILLQDCGLPFERIRVDLASHRTESGQDYAQISSKNAVPLLQLDAGSVLSEGPVIAQYICDRAGRTDLMPAPGTMDRYRVMEWQNFITSELHKSFSPLFNREASADTKALFAARLHDKLGWVSAQLEARDHLCGTDFTAADAYLFTVLGWAAPVGLDLSAHGRLGDYLDRVRARPAVQAALRAEGLLA